MKHKENNKLLFRFAVVGLVYAASMAGLFVPQMARAAGGDTDIRVLVDVSGSMKESDPGNLRQPALRLLAGLLPEGSRAGVWTFGQFVNMQVPHGRVDSAWRDKARKESHKIHSYGLFTNLEGALNRATWDWKKPAPGTRRRLILLSDGMLDMSRDASANDKARARVLQQILPRLKRAGARIHTIALSGNADHELMKQMANQTGGQYVNTDSAESLNRIFLHLFEQSSDTTALPIKQNRFRVDKSVNDMTVLIFSKGKSDNKIVTPDTDAWSRAKHPASAKWHHESEFDLVTITKPRAGVWSLEASQDPDNRVLVVTNLTLSTSEIPRQVFAGETIRLEAWLNKDGKLLSERSLLDRVAVKAEQLIGEDSKSTTVLSDKGEAGDARGGDGRYATTIEAVPAQGEVSVRVQATGPTFERVKHLNTTVTPLPVSLNVGAPSGGETGIIPLSLVVDEKAPPLEILGVALQIPGSKGQPLTLTKDEKAHWMLQAPGLLAGQELEVTIAARTAEGREFSVVWRQTLPRMKTEPKVAEKTETPAIKEAAGKVDPQPAPKEVRKPLKWPLVISLIVFVNAILGLIGLGGYMYWRKRKSTGPAEEAELAYE